MNQTKNDHPRPSGPRFGYIDALRGFAALSVFLLHVHGYWLGNIRPTGVNLTRLLTFTASLGGLGVDLFIVLSGACLFFPVLTFFKASAAKFDTPGFYRRRAFRLLPAYYAALTIAALLVLSPTLRPFLVARPIHWFDIVSCVFLVQTFSQTTTGSINGSFWSIALEAQLYVVFPALVFLWRRKGIGPVVLTGLLSAIFWPFVHAFLMRHTPLRFDPTLHFPARWIEFIAGMAAAEIVTRKERQGEKRRWAALVFALTLPLAIVFHTGLLARFSLPPFFANTASGVCFAALFVLLAGVPERFFGGSNPLGLLNRMGVISYSFYLLHQPLLLLTAPLARQMNARVVGTFGLSLVTALPLTLLFAYGFYHRIERPFLERGRRPSAPVLDSPVMDKALP